jgi:hypothetical protein
MKRTLALLALASAVWGLPRLSDEENRGCTYPKTPVSPSIGMKLCSLRPFFDYVWLDSVSSPPDTIYTDTFIDVRGTAMLHASQDAPATKVLVSFRKYGHGATTYYDSFDLAAGESVPVEWRVGLFPESANYIARESLMDDTPTESSFVTWRFWVLPCPPGAVRDDGRQPATGEKLEPSVVRRIPAGAVAYDALGRPVLNPKRGVYFVRAAPAALPRKVLLVE